MIHTETHLITPDNGPRPAGKPQECLYCRGKVGEEHAVYCPCRRRTVAMRYSFDVVVDVMECWDTQSINFHRNDSSWCATNAICEIENMRESGYFDELEGKDTDVPADCWCDHFKAEYVREATAEDETRLKTKPDNPDTVLSFLDSALIFLTITEDGLRKNKWADMVALGKKAYREYAGEDWKPEGNGK